MNRRTALAALAGSLPALAASEPGRVPVLLELFTSEGCSSCPPADNLLAQLERNPPAGVEIVALAEHVDYWDHLGWRDPFSSSLFSARQQVYAAHFRTDNVYTPQMVVAGTAQAVGSDLAKIQKAIERAAQAPMVAVRIEKTGESSNEKASGVLLRASVESIPSEWKNERFEILLALTENGLSTSVGSGENAGRTLRHTGVVRSIVKVADLDPRKNRGYSAELVAAIAKPWNRSRMRAVMFVQGTNTKAIAGVGTCPL